MTGERALPDWPRLMGIELAAAYVSLSETTLRAKGPTAKKYGKRVLYDRHDLDRWADRLDGQPLDEKDELEESAEVERRFMERRRGKN